MIDIRFLKSTRAFALLSLLVAAMSMSGCNIVGPAAYLIEGPPSVDPVCQLADVPTVVFIDDRNNVVNPISLRRVISDKASQDLMIQKVLTTTISGQDSMTIATQRERSNQIMSMEDIGKAVGAKQMIYVQMVQFQDVLADYTPRPSAACWVRVIDIENRKKIFPSDDSGQVAHLLQVTTREVDPEVYRTRAGREQVFEGLAQTTGEEIGKLFYKHERRQLGANLNPR